MAKIVMEFNGEDDKYAFESCWMAGQMREAINDALEMIKARRKHQEVSEKEDQFLEEVSGVLRDGIMKFLE